MRIVVPLPLGEMEIVIRRSRRKSALWWSILLSAGLHILWVSLFAAFMMRYLVATPQKQPEEVVSISSATRIEKRSHPIPAHKPIVHPRTVALTAQTNPAPAVPQRSARRPEIAKIVPNAPAQSSPQPLNESQMQTQQRMFEKTIALAKVANDPVAGAATDTVTAGSVKVYRINIQGDFGQIHPEGVLTSLKEWTDGPYEYHYVSYLVQYADGTTESGTVPWPIRFPKYADPFAHGIHRMPLPGPLPDYVAPADLTMTPLVKDCYDHRYTYCAIEHE